MHKLILILEINELRLTFTFCTGNSLSAILDGTAKLTFLKRGEDYLITMPYAHCKGKV